MSELFKRIAVAIVGIPVAFFAIYSGGAVLAVAVVIITSIALWEFYDLARKKALHPKDPIGFLLNLYFVLFIAFVPASKNMYPIHLISGLAMIVLLALLVELFSRKGNPLLNLATMGGGFMYVTLPFTFLILLRRAGEFFPESFSFTLGTQADDPWGAWMLLTVFVAVWCCDSFAYFFGRAFGQHKLFPRVSPKKSWEGAVAGFFFAMAAVIGMNALFALGLGVVHSLAIGAAIGVSGQLGDLAESLLKRDAGVKDSSAIIPGHGGVLDRFDSIIFAVPTVYAYLLLVFGK